MTLRVTDETGAQMPVLSLSSLDTTQNTDFAAVQRISGTAQDGIYRAVATIPQGAAPGTWEVVLFPLTDTAGNSGPFGPGDAFPHQITVTSDAVDSPTDEADGPTAGTEEPEAAPYPFEDVSPTSSHAENIQRLVAAGITSGCDVNRFCPQELVTRQQMATFLTRALDLEPSDDLPFTDVTPNSTHDASIRALTASGITQGCAEGRFCPTEPVLRGQMAAFLSRALDLVAPATPIDLVDAPSDHTHPSSIEALAGEGVTQGCRAGYFCPSQPVTREQMASFLARALDL